MNLTERRVDECTTCGARVPGQEFHSYESCLLQRHSQGRLTIEQRQYIFNRGLETIKERVARKELPK